MDWRGLAPAAAKRQTWAPLKEPLVHIIIFSLSPPATQKLVLR